MDTHHELRTMAVQPHPLAPYPVDGEGEKALLTPFLVYGEGLGMGFPLLELRTNTPALTTQRT